MAALGSSNEGEGQMRYSVTSLVDGRPLGTIQLREHSPVGVSYALFYEFPRFVVGLKRTDVLLKMYEDGRVVDVVLADDPSIEVVRLTKESQDAR